MTLFSLDDYLPLSDLAKILVACIVVAVVAPAGVSVAVLGLDLRERRRESATRLGADALIAFGALVLAALIALGIYALFTD